MYVTGAFIMPHPPIILPEIGKGEESRIQKTTNACEKIARQIANLKPDIIVLTSPHSIIDSNCFNIFYGEKAGGNLAQFNAPEVEVDIEYDGSFARELAKQAGKAGLPVQMKDIPPLDHGSIVPLTFINKQYKNYKLVCVSLSELSPAEHYKLGICIADVSKNLNKNTVFVASGDLSHKVSHDGPYGFAEEGVKFDQIITDAMAKSDFLQFLTFNSEFVQQAAVCGLRSFIIMAGALDGLSVDSQLLSYEGTLGVGYAAAAFIPKKEDKSRRFLKRHIPAAESAAMLPSATNEYVSLAKYAVEHYVKTGKYAEFPKNLCENSLNNKAGAFVSIKKNGELRGCIGTIEPTTECIAKEIINNAVSACSKDYRFDPVRADELTELSYSVDILSPKQAVSSRAELDVKRYGVIVTSGNKRGLLLPDLDGVDTVDQQISIAMQKAGIDKSDAYNLERFEVTRYK